MTDADPHAPRTVVPIESSALLAESFDRGRVTDLRHVVASSVAASGLSGQRLEDFVLAVNELLTNAVRHGGGRGDLRLWREGDTVLCEVSDGGGGIGTDRLSDRERPAPDTAGGWGLWLAEQLSDTMLVRSGPTGTTVRIAAAVSRALPTGTAASPAGRAGLTVAHNEPASASTAVGPENNAERAEPAPDLQLRTERQQQS